MELQIHKDHPNTAAPERNRLGLWWDRYIGKLLPRYMFFSLVFCYFFNCLTFWGTQDLMANAYHYDMTTAFDRAIPVIPAFVFIYVSFFAFWFGNFIYISHLGREYWFRFVAADLLTRLICVMFFMLLPTTNVRPDLSGTDLASAGLRAVYANDPPTDLFPSIHCLVSWLCFIGLRGNERVPKGYRRFACVYALLICASTLFVRQHVVADVFSGIAIAELCLYVSKATDLYKPVMRVFDWMEHSVFWKKSKQET